MLEAGICVCSSTWRRNANFSLPSPMWIFTSPALAERMPPTRVSATMRANSSFVGWEERWSEMAISPVPTTFSSKIRSSIILPVNVLTGTWYEPVYT